MSTRPTAIQALAANPTTAGLVLDFDGVLSPIVDDPTTSAIPDLVVRSLPDLPSRWG
jgi:trehalose-6-phosphatase